MLPILALGLKLHFAIVVGCNTADLVTTFQAFNRGAVEGNGIVSGQPRIVLSASKLSATGAILTTVKLLNDHGHERIARAVAIVDASASCAAAVHNTRVLR